MYTATLKTETETENRNRNRKPKLTFGFFGRGQSGSFRWFTAPNRIFSVNSK